MQANLTGMVGSVLTYNGRVIHLGVFPIVGRITPDNKGTRIPLIE